MASTPGKAKSVKSASQLLKFQQTATAKQELGSQSSKEVVEVGEICEESYDLDEASSNVLKAAEEAEAQMTTAEGNEEVWIKIVTPKISEDSPLTRGVKRREIEDVPEYVTEKKLRHMLKSGEMATIDYINENIEAAQSPEIPTELSYMISNLKMNKDIVKEHVKLFSSDFQDDDYRKNKMRQVPKRAFLGQCRHCSESVSSLTEMSTHMRSVHKEIEYKPWSCPVCSYGCPARSTLVKHMNVHCHRKLFECPECGKGFNFKQKLQQHMKYHLNVRDQECPLCSMAFHELKTLKTHLFHVHNLDRRSSKRGGWVKPEYFTLDGDLVTEEQLEAMKNTSSNAPQPPELNHKNAEEEERPEDQTIKAEIKELSKIPKTNDICGTYSASRCVKLRGAVKTDKYTKGYKEGLIRKDTSQKKHPIVVTEDTMQSIINSGQMLEEEQMYVDKPKPEEKTETISIEIVNEDYVEKLKESDNLAIEDDNVVQLEVEGDKEAKLSEYKTVQCKDGSLLLVDSKKPIKKGRSPSKQRVRTSQGECVSVDSDGNEEEITVQLDVPIEDVSEVVVKHESDGTAVLQVNEQSKSTNNSANASFTEKPVARMPRSKGKMTAVEEYVPDLADYCGMVQHVTTSGQHVRSMYMCKLCSSEVCADHLFRNVMTFLDHVRAEHPDISPWKCNRCEFTCKVRNDMIEHLQEHAVSKEASCSLCFKQFNNKKELSAHMTEHTKTNEIVHKFSCNLCKQAFATQGDLNNHTKRVHSIARPYECEQCGKRYPDEAYLKRHATTHATSKNYMCQYCHKYYRTPMSLNQHMKSHTCLFHCDICNRSFGSYSGFMAHKVMHDQTGAERGFECHVCHKKLLTKGSLVRHLTVAHSNRRPFTCDDCNKSFKTKKDLKNHQIIHDSGKTLECSLCSFSTKRSMTMKMHMKRHEEGPGTSEVAEQQGEVSGERRVQFCASDGTEEKLTCDLCSLTFPNQDELVGHVLAQHLHAPQKVDPNNQPQEVIIDHVEEDGEYVIYEEQQ